MTFEEYQDLLLELYKLDNDIEEKYKSAYQQLIFHNAKRWGKSPFLIILELTDYPTYRDYEYFIEHLAE